MPDRRFAQAMVALTGVGLEPARAQAAIERAATHVSRDADVDDLIRAALE